MLWLLLLLVVLALIYYYIKSNQRTQIVRFYRDNCKYCVESQPEWDAFKAMALADKVEFDIVDVDIQNNSIHTRRWLDSYKIISVPTVLKITGWGSKEYDGPRISTAYMAFALEK